MPEMLMHSASQRLVAAYLNNPTQAICLTGEVGCGLGSIAKYLADHITEHSSDITVIRPEKNTIPIEVIRSLYIKTRSVQQKKRCLIIDDAESMSFAAQNAFLKLLEEPSKQTYFILTTHSTHKLLPTITSRLQMVNLLPLSVEQSVGILNDHKVEAKKAQQILFLAQGKPAELTRLASNEAYFEKKVTRMSDARKFLEAKSYDRLSVLKNYSDRDNALDFLNLVSKLLRFTLSKTKQYQLANSLEALDEVIGRIAANGHVKTQLMYLVTKL